MKIACVEAIPLWASFADAFGSAEQVPHEIAHPAFGMRAQPLEGQGCVLVRITDSEGRIGYGESMGRPVPRGTAAYIDEVLAPLLVGEDPFAIEAHWAVMSEQLSFAPMALSGVDTALWDLKARALGLPIHRLLGGPFRRAIDCYASPIPFLPRPDGSAAWARRFVEQGFAAIKLKIGRGLAVDVEHVAAVRAAIGPDVRLLVDCNGAYRASEAIQLGRALLASDVYWFEEPVNWRFRDDLREVRRRVDLPVASGEWLDCVAAFDDLLRADAADVLMPNVTRCGGVTALRKIGDLAARRNVAIAPHGVGSGVGILAAIQAANAIEHLLIYEYNQLVNPLRHAILAAPIPFQDGVMPMPTGDGLGCDINLATVDRYRVDRPG